MEEGLQKFIKRMMLKKYPFILEIYVIKSFGSPPHFESKHLGRFLYKPKGVATTQTKSHQRHYREHS